MSLRVTLLPIWVALCCTVVYGSHMDAHEVSSSDEDYPNVANEDSIKLTRLSFSSPLGDDPDVEDWDVSMASVPHHSSVVLLPSVPGRMGWFFAKTQILTHNFDVYFRFKVVGPEAATQSEGFALWFLDGQPDLENRTKLGSILNVNMEDYAFMGYRASFKGLGVFFRPFDKSGSPAPSISVLFSDGAEKFEAAKSLPSEHGMFFNWRNVPHTLTFHLRRNGNTVTGRIKTGTDPNSFVECFTLIDTRLNFHGYLGFTASSGKPVEYTDRNKRIIELERELRSQGERKDVDPSGFGPLTSDAIYIHSMRTYNLDFNSIGQVGETDIHFDPRKERHDLIHDHLNPQRLADEVHHLNKIMTKFLTENTMRENSLVRSLSVMTADLNKLREEIRHLKFSGDAVGGSATDESVKTELVSLKQLLHRHTQHQATTLQSIKTQVEDVSSPIAKLGSFASSARSLEKTLSAHSSYHFIVGILVIGSMVVIGLFVWKGFRDMEKRHLL